ncbi:uncharacterized protein LODBEIA_P08210 [Lodderomyces beijingensis]|uniref:Anaphase-promoting complex subunit 4 WD40 domain-containing protein n=1 Tax=Lodderomyces beijingensis TaxID=1775926 RepID=A0ABP0ZEL9_9ASCO
MPIKPSSITPPHPSTVRGQASHFAYDARHDRIAYVNGKSVVVRPADFNSGSPVVVFTKHNSPTTAVKFAPSGFYIASGDASGNVKIWDCLPKKGDEEFEQPIIKSEFQVMSGPVKSIAWDADSSRLIAVGHGREKFGHAFSWDTGNSIGDIQGHSDAINAVDIRSQRPYRAATVGNDFAMVFFNGPPFKFDKSLRGHHTNVVRDVKFSPNGEHLVSVGSDRSICLFDGKTGEFVQKIENAHNGGIFAVAWSPLSDFFITASADATLKKWDAKSSTELQIYQVTSKPSPSTQQVGLVVANEYIISLSSNGDLNYFSPGDGALVKTITGHQLQITNVKFAKDAVYSGSSNGKLLKYRVAKGMDALLPDPTLLGTEESGHSNYLSDILIEEGDQNSLFTIGWDDEIKKWKDGSLLKSVHLSKQPKQLVNVGAYIVLLYENEVQVFDKELEVVEKFELPFTATYATAFGKSSVLLANAIGNTIVQLDFETNGKFQTNSDKSFPVMRSAPALIKVSPNGEYIAVADSAGKYTLLDAQGQVVSTRWAFHTARVYDAEWTSDSKYLVSGGLDGGLILYSAEKPSKVVKFPLAHASGVSSLAWLSYDADKGAGTFASGGLDGTIRTWKVTI